MRRSVVPSIASRRGFTLVEVLIVVVILGILAATVLPQFTSATEDAKESALRQNLQQLRSQIDLYRFQHNGNVPAVGSTTELDLLQAMLLTTDVNGATTGTITPTFSLGSGPYGPYLLGQFPPNPFNGLNTVKLTAGSTPVVDNTTGWWYDSTTGMVRANLPATMLAGDEVTALNSL